MVRGLGTLVRPFPKTRKYWESLTRAVAGFLFRNLGVGLGISEPRARRNNRVFSNPPGEILWGPQTQTRVSVATVSPASVYLTIMA